MHLFQNHLLTKYTYAAHQYWEKVSEIYHPFCLDSEIPSIMNLIFCIMKFHEVEIRDKLYHQTISNEINFIFLIISFGKMSSSKSLPSSGTESKMERMSDF